MIQPKLTRENLGKPGSLKGVAVGLLGFGTENKDLLSLLSAEGAVVTVFDQRSLVEIPVPDQALIRQSGAELVAGKGYIGKIRKQKVVFRSPGVPAHARPIQLLARRAMVVPPLELFLRRAQARGVITVGVTGTKGKGTTSSIIAALAKTIAGRRVVLAGNIGVSPFNELMKLEAQDIAILELSSFQLEDMKVSPNIGVVLPVTADHLAPLSPTSPNFHPSQAAYREAKEAITAYTSSADTTIISLDGPSWTRYVRRARGRVWFSSGNQSYDQPGVYFHRHVLWQRTVGRGYRLAREEDLSLLGRFNWTNVSAACAAALAMGVQRSNIAKVLQSIKPLPHRLEKVAEEKGVLYVDDSMGTNPQTAAAALLSFDQPVHLIAGGSSKGANFKLLIKAMKSSSLRMVYGIGAEGSRIGQAMRAAGLGAYFQPAGTLEEAVRRIRRHSSRGEVVLLSPACASFDQFKSASDRGNQFRALVKGEIR